MSIASRSVAGKIQKLVCANCAAESFAFTFEGEGDVDTEALCSATSCGTKDVVLVEATADEWNAFGCSGPEVLQNRIRAELALGNLVVNKLVRVETTKHPANGLAFAEFRKTYRHSELVFQCPCCFGGEARSSSECSFEEFVSLGGQIVTTGRLALQKS